MYFNQLAVFDEYNRHEEMTLFRVTTSILVKRKEQLQSTASIAFSVVTKIYS